MEDSLVTNHILHRDLVGDFFTMGPEVKTRRPVAPQGRLTASICLAWEAPCQPTV